MPMPKHVHVRTNLHENKIMTFKASSSSSSGTKLPNNIHMYVCVCEMRNVNKKELLIVCCYAFIVCCDAYVAAYVAALFGDLHRF